MEYDEMTDYDIQKEVLKDENRYEDLKDRVHYQYEEIQQLKKKYRIMKENAETLAKRIDKAIEYINKYEEIHGINYMFENEDFKEVLDKLQELKGSDKE